MRLDTQKRRAKVLEAFRRVGTIRGTARELGMARKTIRRALKGQYRPRSYGPKASKLDPYKAVAQRLVVEDGLTAVLALEELRALGYDGSYTTLKEYVRTIRPSPKRKVTTVIDHPPGAEGQVDWSPYKVHLGGEERIVHGFSLVLPFSRFMVVRFAMDEKLETLLRLHDEAFERIGAIPPLMTYDNMTTVGRHTSAEELKLTARFEAYMERCGFDVALIDPGRPNQHASVERPFHYVEHNCLLRRRSRFDSLEDLNRHAAWWCDKVANVRVHGTTRERPVDRLELERPLMLPLPSLRVAPYQEVSRKVGSDFCVALSTNRYSVPPRHVGQPATLRVSSEKVDVLVGGKVVASHRLCEGRHQRLVLAEHEDDFKKHAPSRLLLEQAFLRLGPAANDYYDGLRVHRGGGAGYHLQRILLLADRHGSDLVCGAMAHAARYGNYSADAVRRVIVGRELTNKTEPDNASVSSTPPERVRLWLEGLYVEKPNLDDYDELIDQRDHNDGGDDDE